MIFNQTDKIFVIAVIVFLFKISNGQNKNYKLTYEITKYKNPVFEQKLNRKQEIFLNNELKSLKQYTKGFKLNIYSNTNNYIFKIDDGLSVGDKNPYKRTVNLNFLGLSENVLYSKNIVYYHFKTDKFITKIKPNEVTKWKISDVIKIINGYKCYKAKLINTSKYNFGFKTQNVTAWFAPQYNIKGGPTLFATLPGLIIVLENNFARFELIKFEEVNKNIMTVKEFVKNKKVYTIQESDKYYKKIGDMIENRF